MAIKPENMLQNSLNKKVVIELRDGTVYKGTLQGYDEYDNVVLKNIVKVKEEGETEPLKEGVFKGGNIVYISKE